MKRAKSRTTGTHPGKMMEAAIISDVDILRRRAYVVVSEWRAPIELGSRFG